MAENNATILASIWMDGTNEFQQRIPNPDQASMQQVSEALFDPMNKMCWNQFIDALVNRIGTTYCRGKRWDNKLAAFKGSSLQYGNTIQEVAINWIRAHSYEDDDETLLKMNRPEAQAWYHSVNRQDRYDITINDMELRRAFTEEYGLNDCIAKIMLVPQNSDNWDEYISMRQLIAFYNNNWGFYKEHVSAITDETTGKAFLQKARAYAKRLTFPSTLYNAPGIDIPVFADPDELILITTPEIEAALDVQALSAVFNLDKAELKYRTIIVDEFPISGAQALLTTRDWFVCSDVVMQNTSFWDAKNLCTQYFLHHHEIISCSPFVPAVLFTTDAATSRTVVKETATGISVTTDKSSMTWGDEAQITVTLNGSLDTTVEGITVAPDAATFTVELLDSSEEVIAGINSRTYVDKDSVLHLQKKAVSTAAKVRVTATSTYYNPSDGETEALAAESVTIDIA